jgi:hypothetical protein
MAYMFAMSRRVVHHIGESVTPRGIYIVLLSALFGKAAKFSNLLSNRCTGIQAVTIQVDQAAG